MNLNPCTYFVKESKPDKIAGYLNRKIGYNHYHPLEIGTPVYEDKRGFYMIQELIKTGDKHKIYWYKDGPFKNHFNPVSL